MARLAVQDGITCMAATPHNMNWPAGDHRPRVQEAVHALSQSLQAAGISLELLPGAEIFADMDVPQHIAEGRAFPLAASRYLLLELPASAYPLYTEELIFRLQVQGFWPILAHPERNVHLQEDPEVLRTLVERGVLMQITAGSLLGEFGRRAAETSADMLKGGLAHIIASDAHGAAHRPPILTPAVEAAGEIIGMAPAVEMAAHVPRAILEGERVEPARPPEAETTRRFGWLHRRPFA